MLYLFYPAKAVKSKKTEKNTMVCKICGDVENHRSRLSLFEGIGAIRKDFETRRLIAIDLSYNDISLPRMEICEKCTVRQLKECVSDTLKEENDTVIKAENMRLSVLRSSKKEKETSDRPLWYLFNDTKILDPRIHDGVDGVFASIKNGDKHMKRIVSLKVENETRDVKKMKTQKAEEETKRNVDDTMFGLDDVREAELQKHPKYRPQKCATVMGLKWDIRDSSFLANNQDMSRRRVGILYAITFPISLCSISQSLSLSPSHTQTF